MAEEIKCGYIHCNNTFAPRIGKQYCSGSCRAKASVVNRAQLGTIDVKPQNIVARQPSFGRQSLPTQQDPQSQYIINHLTKESDRWEKLYNDEKASRKKLKEKNEELEKKILTMENETRIAAIENAKPSGLNGLLTSPHADKLIEMCAPLIQRMMEPQQPAVAQMTGTEGQQQTPALVFQNWFVKLSLPTQQTVWRMLQSFTFMPDAELKEYAAKVISAIQAEYPQAVNQ